MNKSDKFFARKRFSIRKRMVIIFSFLIILAVFGVSFISIRIAQKIVIENTNELLKNKAYDTAGIIDDKLWGILEYMRGIARSGEIRNEEISFPQKAKILSKEKEKRKFFRTFGIADEMGKVYEDDGVRDASNMEWFKNSGGKEGYISEPYFGEDGAEMLVSLSVPIIEDEKYVGTLVAQIDGLRFSKIVGEIEIGKTGACYMIGKSGNIVAAKDKEMVKTFLNFTEKSKTDPSLNDIAAIAQQSLTTENPTVAEYSYEGVHKFCAYYNLYTTGWGVVVFVSAHEFMKAVHRLALLISIAGAASIISALNCASNPKYNKSFEGYCRRRGRSYSAPSGYRK